MTTLTTPQPRRTTELTAIFEAEFNAAHSRRVKDAGYFADRAKYVTRRYELVVETRKVGGK